MSKPEDIAQDVWDTALEVFDTYLYNGESAQEIIARALLTAKAEERQNHADLVDCLDDMTKHYVELAGSGDCGNWDAEQEIEVIAARQMIAQHREVNTAHKNSVEV